MRKSSRNFDKNEWIKHPKIKGKFKNIQKVLNPIDTILKRLLLKITRKFGCLKAKYKTLNLSHKTINPLFTPNQKMPLTLAKQEGFYTPFK